MTKNHLTLIICILLTGCLPKAETSQATSNTDVAIQEYLKNGAWNYHYLSKEWDEWISKGLKEYPDVAYLWQQKALPLWKQKKYQLATSYYDKAVALDREKWLSRRGFLKCIFSKDYQSAIDDLIAHNTEYGSTYEQNHLLEFYIGISHLQLNQFNQALAYLNENIDKQIREQSIEWVSVLDWFYLGITYYEMGDYSQAIAQFDKALKDYPTFSDAQFYKSVCLKYMNQKEEAKQLMALGKVNADKGYSFGEDSNFYETYPYQISWQWAAADALIE